jgi:hypothetical protein
MRTILRLLDRIKQNEGIPHYPEMVNDVDVLVSKLLHDALDLPLALDDDLVLLRTEINPLRKYLELRLISFPFGV